MKSLSALAYHTPTVWLLVALIRALSPDTIQHQQDSTDMPENENTLSPAALTRLISAWTTATGNQTSHPTTNQTNGPATSQISQPAIIQAKPPQRVSRYRLSLLATFATVVLITVYVFFQSARTPNAVPDPIAPVQQEEAPPTRFPSQDPRYNRISITARNIDWAAQMHNVHSSYQDVVSNLRGAANSVSHIAAVQVEDRKRLTAHLDTIQVSLNQALLELQAVLDESPTPWWWWHALMHARDSPEPTREERLASITDRLLDAESEILVSISVQRRQLVDVETVLAKDMRKLVAAAYGSLHEATQSVDQYFRIDARWLIWKRVYQKTVIGWLLKSLTGTNGRPLSKLQPGFVSNLQQNAVTAHSRLAMTRVGVFLRQLDLADEHRLFQQREWDENAFQLQNYLLKQGRLDSKQTNDAIAEGQLEGSIQEAVNFVGRYQDILNGELGDFMRTWGRFAGYSWARPGEHREFIIDLAD